MRNWLIKKLGGSPKWDGAIECSDAHVHLHLDEDAIRRLIDYALNGVFYKLQPKRRPTRSASPENQTLGQLETKLIGNLITSAPHKQSKKKKK